MSSGTVTGEWGVSHSAHEDIVVSLIPLVTKTLRDMPLDLVENTFTICDFGAANGANSMRLISECIDVLLTKYKGKTIQLIYQDQINNNFSAVFNRIEGLIPGQTCFLKNENNVFVSCIGQTFYKQCLPDRSLHFGFSSSAVQHLSCIPCTFDNDVFHFGLPLDSIENQSFARQAAIDWEKFLLLRARELVEGGYLVIVVPTIEAVPKDRKLLFRAFSPLLENGTITKEEFQSMTFNIYFRNDVELKSPFKDRETAVSKAGLELISYKVYTPICPLRMKWQQDRQTGDARAADNKYAEDWTKQIKSGMQSTILCSLANERSEEEKQRIVDEFIKNFADVIAENPAERQFSITSAQMIIRKKHSD